MLCRQFCSLYWLQEPAALAAMQAAMKAKPIEEFGPPSAELWSAVLVRRSSSVSAEAARGGWESSALVREHEPFTNLQDVLELSEDQKLALVATRRKLQCTVEDINLQREQVQGHAVDGTLSAHRPMSSRSPGTIISVELSSSFGCPAHQCSAQPTLGLSGFR